MDHAEQVTLACLHCGQANRFPAGRAAAHPRCAACKAELLGGEVAELTPARLDKAIRMDSLPLVVDFWAPWCGPCRAMAPNFAAAARDLSSQVRFAKIDTEAHPDLGGRFRIQGIPLLIRFAAGREAARLTGLRPAAEIVQFARGAPA